MCSATTIASTLKAAATAIANRPAHNSLATSSNLSDARLDAEVLLGHVLDQSRSWLYAHSDYTLEDDTWQQYSELLNDRIKGIPVAILTGHQEFWSLALKVTSDVLVPRPETEQLVEIALETIHSIRTPRILELGTGSGAIAIALASERQDADITATDLSAAALTIASDNAAQLSKKHPACAAIHFLESNWFQALTAPPGSDSQKFDLIVSNPPYLASDDPHLAGDIRHEPIAALVGGPQGLDMLAEIIATAPEYLQPSGSLILEHGATQGEDIRQMLQRTNYTCVKTCNDLAGLPRITSALNE